jgi:DNA-binding response OmpR family regulator
MTVDRLFDLLIVDPDMEQGNYYAARLRGEGAARTLVHRSARDALAAFSRVRFDAILCAPKLSDTDCWRFIRMVRSARFGYAATPCFVLCRPEEIAALVPMTDEHTMLLDDLDDPALLARLRAQCAGQSATTVLIVEDEIHAAQAAARALEKFYTVQIVNDGRSALAAWTTHRHALVILDLGLPDIPGDEVLARLLQQKPDQCVIILTAQDAPEAHQRLMLLGATQFLSKPIDLHFLADACARVLRERACLANAERAKVVAAAHHQLAVHLQAASVRLNAGQTASASVHLRHALVASRSSAPSDDQWTDLLSEFGDP